MSCNQCAEQSSQVVATRSQTNAIFDRADKGTPAFGQTPFGNMMVRRVNNSKAVTSYGVDKHGILRCHSCGRFVSPTGAGHICPNSATVNSMTRAIERRTGFPASFFGDGFVSALWKEGTTKGAVSMKHPVTGAEMDVDLDALVLAINMGYKPKDWNPSARYLAQNRKGQVYEVAQQPVYPGLREYAPQGAVQEAAAAYGHAQTSAPVGPTPAPAATLNKVSIGPDALAISGTGATYDMGRLGGSEFRKASSSKGGLRGTTIPGTTYQYGERYSPSQHSSSFRTSGMYGQAKTIVAGRTFVEAAQLLSSGQRQGVVTNNGDVVELYEVDNNGKRGGLKAIFDASGPTWVAGDTDGSTNLSVEQAAAMAHWMAYSPKSHLGPNNYLAQDLNDAAIGNHSVLAASDSIYIGLQLSNPQGDFAEFGCDTQSQRCGDCGQWMGSAHDCPISGKSAQTPASSPSPKTKNTAPSAPKSKGSRGKKQAQAAMDSQADQKSPTAQEIILGDVMVSAPDKTLRGVPGEWGGQLPRPILQDVPQLNSNFIVDEVNEPVLASISSSLQVAAQLGDNRHAFKFRAFGLAGPPSAGKNELIRQVAASIKWQDESGNTQQGLAYTEATITDKSTVDEVIGGVVMEDTGTGTRTRVALGPVGMALASGSVVAVNEIVRNPKLATAFQSIMEDGLITINSPESGTITIPVHPSSALFMTWNPGYEGDADRPALAALSRMTTFRMDQPSDETVDQRVASFFSDMIARSDAFDDVAQSSVTLRESYKIPPLEDLQPTETEVRVARQFWRQVQAATGANGSDSQRVGFNSINPPSPQIRDLYRFVTLGKTVGWKDASRMFQICCDQDEDFANQWATIESLFAQNFGADGNALNRQP